MKPTHAIKCLFLDIGGFLLTDGWDRHARRRAATTFKLDVSDMEKRHHLTFEAFEDVKLTLEEYLDLVVFQHKPDADIFRLALDIAQVSTDQIAYVEDTPMFVQIANAWGFEAFFTRSSEPRVRRWRRSD